MDENDDGSEPPDRCSGARRDRLCHIDQPRANSKFDQLGGGMQVELVHDALAVPGDCFRADPKLFANLLVGRSLSYRFKNLLFTHAKHIQSSIFGLISTTRWRLWRRLAHQ